MSSEKRASALKEITPQKLAQWRSNVRSFFSTSWVEVQEVIEALEAEIDEEQPAPQPALASGENASPRAAAPSEPPRPEPTKPGTAPRRSDAYDADPVRAAPKEPKRPLHAAPPRTGAPQDARLAELARRIEERLRQSRS